MIPLPEETKTAEILDKAKRRMPTLRIPPMTSIHFFNRGNDLLGLGGSRYGIGINVQHLNEDGFEETVLHELVHYQGIYGHEQKFWDKFGEIKHYYYGEEEHASELND